MPIDLTWFERQIFLRRNWGPGPILDIFSILAYKTIHTAVKLGVFETLATRGPSSVRNLSRQLDADENGLKLVLDALAALGYLRVRRGPLYENSAMTGKWMLANGEGQLCRVFGYFDDAFERWSELDKAILGKRPARTREVIQWLDSRPGAWDRYHEGVRGVATLIAPQVASAVKLPRAARRLIDIGGSHGLYSIALCRRRPELSATIFDLETARTVAGKTIAATGMGGQVTFTAGDIMKDTPPGSYDVVLLVNTLRGFDGKRAASLFARIYGLLNPGGVVLVADQFRLPTRTPFSRLNATMILLELYNGGATLYTDRQVIDLLCTAGFRETRMIRLRRTPGIHLVTGKRL